VKAKWRLVSSLVEGTRATELHPALARRAEEVFLVKQRSSAFFGTTLLSQLVALGVDTAVVVGLSTSGCVRSTCEEAFNYNLRVVVPREAVGDRCESAHEAALFDIDARFGDVVPLGEALGALRALAPVAVADGSSGVPAGAARGS
jgi:nicotinamidase-related amidase